MEPETAQGGEAVRNPGLAVSVGCAGAEQGLSGGFGSDSLCQGVRNGPTGKFHWHIYSLIEMQYQT